VGERSELGTGDPYGAGDLAVRRADGDFSGRAQQIPTDLYEAAAVDGAGRGRQFWNITLPMLSPVIFFNLVLETIHGFQGFTAAFVLSNGTGGPIDSTLMYTLNLYIKGFTRYEMGYAAAMAWVFLLVVGLVTAVLFTTGRFWVHYSDGAER
jgi:multiple sugar transport system permease protein